MLNLVRFLKDFYLLAKLLPNFLYDLWRYWKFAFNERLRDQSHYISNIWMYTHSIEKGLSVPSNKMGFGKDVVKKLVTLLSLYKSYGFDENQVAVSSALGALEQYLILHTTKGYDLGEMADEIRSILNLYKVPKIGGTKKLKRVDIQQSAKGDFYKLVSSRHSIRQFTSEPIELSTLEEAIRLAIKTPSMCNRQPWRVYICMDNKKITRLTQIQGGTSGFGTTIPCLLVITTDLASYDGVSERRGPFIDGGLFCMSLIYALFYLGFGVCPLHWCKNLFADRKLRKEFGIKNSEEIIMMLAVGNMPEEFTVPRSEREKLEKFRIIL
ncbi:MAG: nitroreductase family protein [Candidatus Aenigmatarchaeota archaeon]